MMGNTSTASQIPEPVNQHSVRGYIKKKKKNVNVFTYLICVDLESRTTTATAIVKKYALNGFAVCFKRGLLFARRKTCIKGIDSFCVRHRFRTSPRSPNHSRPRPSTRWPRPHLGNSLPLAPSDQFRTETVLLLVCDGDLVGLVLGRHVQVGLPSHVLRADSIALTPPARCAWRSSHLSACCWHCSLCHGSWGPNPACFPHGSLGPNPWLFFFLHVRLARVFRHFQVSLSLCRDLLSALR